jgi:hypothetical protein
MSSLPDFFKNKAKQVKLSLFTRQIRTKNCLVVPLPLSPVGASAVALQSIVCSFSKPGIHLN